MVLKELKQYVIDRHNITLVTGIEADDAVSMAVYEGYVNHKRNNGEKVVGVAIDKDSRGCTGFWYNPDKDKETGIREINGFGELTMNEKGGIEGYGRMWFYYQMCYGDLTDNYKASCHSATRWGEKSAYEALKDCTDDKEAWEALVKTFKKLYPEPKEVDTFRGKITIDWLYVLQEMAVMAHMLRCEGDKIVVKDVLDRLEISYE